jgi:hypothetical protein
MRNTELTRSQQVIVSAVISAAVSVLLVLGIALYQGLTGAWYVSNTAMMTYALIISLAMLLKEIIQMLIASEQLQKMLRAQEAQLQKAQRGRAEQWIAVARTDTAPYPVARPGKKLGEYLS